MLKLKNNISKVSIYLSLLTVVTIMLIAKDWTRENKVIVADVVSYYAYLPAAFIFNDIKLEHRETYDKGIFWPEPLPDGNKVIKTSMGMSILYSPFFFASHGVAKVMGWEAFGYSPIYKIGLLTSAVFYLFIGLFFLRRILKIYFSEQITALTILTIVLGTNLLNYATYDACTSHVYNFALINVFIWYTIQWYKSPQFFNLILLGLLSGLITLVRPSNIIVLVFFFTYGIFTKENLKERIRLIFTKFHWFLFMALAFVLVWVPQFIYWWKITGHFVVNSYPDEQFFWGNPHFFDGFFSYRKGWLVYTPVMIFALLGIPFLFKKLKEFSWAIFVFISVATYIIVSWWCWWYGGSFGMRSFVDYYGLLAIPMALLFSLIWDFRKNAKIIVLSIFFLSILQNNFFLEKYKRSSIHYDSTSKASFWHSFWYLRPQEGYWELLERPDYAKALEGIDAITTENK
ncbi:MAG TPA: hypothetical protein VLQ91_17310 [Draconibacterium sp.]|nr:hypothetical protein [Draconibacterium sp.]